VFSYLSLRAIDHSHEFILAGRLSQPLGAFHNRRHDSFSGHLVRLASGYLSIHRFAPLIPPARQAEVSWLLDFVSATAKGPRPGFLVFPNTGYQIPIAWLALV
jgi:hypothetical protein